MKQHKSTALLLMALIFVVVNVIFFVWVTPSNCGTAEWLSYGFMVASLLFACISIGVYNGKNDEVYSLSEVYVPVRYFFVQTFLSACGVIAAQICRGSDTSAGSDSFFANYFVAILLTVYVVVCLVFVIRFIIHRKANSATEASIMQQHEEHSYVRDLSGMLSNLLPLVSDANARKSVNNLYETVRFSANKTSESGQMNRQEVAEGVVALSKLVAAKDWQSVAELASQLNLKAKMQ